MKHVFFIGLATLLFSCSNSKFSGEADKKNESEDAKPEDIAAEDSQDKTKVKNEQKEEAAEVKSKPILADEAEEILAEDGELSEEDKKIVGCIEEWGQANFSKEALKGYKKLNTSNEGFAASVLKDSKKTDEPRLVLVSASSTGFSGVRMELLNPNGWYCVDVKNIGFSSSSIMLHCDSEVAGYSAENKGFSSAQESRVGC